MWDFVPVGRCTVKIKADFCCTALTLISDWRPPCIALAASPLLPIVDGHKHIPRLVLVGPETEWLLDRGLIDGSPGEWLTPLSHNPLVTASSRYNQNTLEYTRREQAVASQALQHEFRCHEATEKRLKEQHNDFEDLISFLKTIGVPQQADQSS